MVSWTVLRTTVHQKKVKRQATDKGGFLSRICKEFLLIKTEKSDKPTEKMGKLLPCWWEHELV